MRLIGSDCISGDERSRSAAMQIEAAELVSQTTTLRRPRALLPAIIGCDLFAARKTSAVTRALLACCRCLLAAAACLLPSAAATCYICCHRLLCENQARGRSGLEAILGRVLSNQFLGRFGRFREHEAASFTRGKNSIALATKGAMRDDAHACYTLLPFVF